MEKELEEIIVKHFGEQPKKEVYILTQNLCNHLMIQTNNLLQSNLYIWDEDKIKDYVKRIEYYANINSVILQFKNGVTDRNKVNSTIIEADHLYNLVKSEFIIEFNNSNQSRKKEIIDELLLPHISFIWLLKNN